MTKETEGGTGKKTWNKREDGKQVKQKRRGGRDSGGGLVKWDTDFNSKRVSFDFFCGLKKQRKNPGYGQLSIK